MGKSTSLASLPNDHYDRQALTRLKRAIASGREEEIDRAFEDIYRTYVRLVAFVCGKYLSEDDDIKLITNDVFVSFFRHLDRLDSDGQGLKYYLTVSAKNAALNHLRDMQKHREVIADTEEAVEASRTVPDPDSDLGASIRYRELIRDLSSCMDETALNIVLRHAVMGETFPAIAETLGMKSPTVKTIYHRALAAFRREKGNHWI